MIEGATELLAPIIFKHGRNGYSKHHCRCDVCREEQSAYKNAYRILNHDKLLEQDRQQRLRDPEKYRARARERYQKNPLELESKRVWRAVNSERWGKYCKEYRMTHRKEALDYTRKRLEDDPVFRLTQNLRHRVYMVINNSNSSKSDHTMKLIGCSVEELKKHLESCFSQGMTWENYGLHGWHIDHIRPCASFDLTDPEQQRECFNWNNIRPLWAKENWVKSSKWDGIRWKKLGGSYECK